MTDSNQIFRCEAGIGQRVRGVALCANDNFSARYDLDRIRGIFSRTDTQTIWRKLCRESSCAEYCKRGSCEFVDVA